MGMGRMMSVMTLSKYKIVCKETEIVIMVGVWLNALINLYNFTSNRKKK
jgi:hypothetical protein